jgi:hypothetical protein
MSEKVVGHIFTGLPSFAASGEGRTFGDENGCRAARCDGLKMRNLLFIFYLIPFRTRAVIMRRHFCGCMKTSEEGIFGRQLFESVNYWCYVLIFYSVVTIMAATFIES